MTDLLDHPLIAAYLGDLDRALIGVDPTERADVLAGIREDLTERLAGPTTPSPDRVRRALDALGPVERIAAAATPLPPVPAPATAGAGSPVLGPVLLGAAVLGVLLVPTLFPSVAVCLVVLVTALVVGRRRLARHRGLVTAAAVVAGLGLLVSSFVLLFLVGAGSGDGVSEPVQIGIGTGVAGSR